MRNKLRSIISGLLSAALTAGCLFVPFGAQAAESDEGIKISQKIESVTGTSSEQTYTVSYNKGDVDAASGSNSEVSLTLTFDDAFSPDAVSVGSWDGYDGNFIVTIGEPDSSSDSNSDDENEDAVLKNQSIVKENEEVDLSKETGYSSITIQPTNKTGIVDFSNVKLTGTLSCKDFGEKSKMTASYAYVLSDSNGEKKTDLGSKSVETLCNSYKISDLEISSGKSVKYLNDITITAGKLKMSADAGLPSKITIDCTIPSALYIDKATIPGMTSGTCDIYVDGSKQSKSGKTAYVNKKASSIQFVIYPEKEDFAITAGAKIQGRSVSNTTGTKKVECKAELIDQTDNVVQTLNASTSFKLEKAESESSSSSSSSSGVSTLSVGTTSVKNSGSSSSQKKTTTSSSENKESASAETETEKTSETESTASDSGSSTTTSSKKSSSSSSSSSVSDVVTSLDEEEEEEEDVVVDYSGLNLMSAKATPKSINTVYHDGDISTDIDSAMSDSAQTTEVIDVDTDSSGSSDTASADGEEAVDDLTTVTGRDYAEDNIDDVSGYDAIQDGADTDSSSSGGVGLVLDAIEDNRSIQLGLIAVALLIIAAIVLGIMIHRSSRKAVQAETGADDDENDEEDPSDDAASEEESDSGDDQNASQNNQ